jgi:hypothetical protein
MSEREQPDPGEGWRYLKVGEQIKVGDESGEEFRPVNSSCVGEDVLVPNAFRRRIFMPDTLRDLSEPQPDLVNAPPHYRQGGIECIDAIRAALTEEEFRGFIKGNAIKYAWREKHKGGDEDLKKAAWYLNRIETIKMEQPK